jgi:oxaloacetate decarboxylase alpha subunit/pyruvate carboxylase subunit B
VPINPEVQKKALKGYARGEEPITCRPAEVLEPELEKAKKDIGDLAKDIDDLVLYAIYPVTGKKFLEWKYGVTPPPPEVMAITLDEVKKRDDLVAKAKAGKLVEPKATPPAKSENVRTFNVFVDKEYFSVEVDPTGDFQPMVMAAAAPRAAAPKAAAPAAAAPKAAAPAAAAAPKAAAPTPAVEGGTPLLAPMPGMVIKNCVNVGDAVKTGDALVILEAMKMENSLGSPCDGVVKAFYFGSGDSVAKDTVLAVVG